MSEENRFPGESPGPYGWVTTPTNPPAKPRSRLWPRLLALAATVAGLAITGAVFLSANTATAGTGTILSATAPIVAETQPASAYSGAIQASGIAAKVDPAVVDVNTVFQTATASGSAAGTGIIITSNGEILTNNHVVEGATSITVTIAGRTGSYTAQVLGVDPTADVALIQVEGVTGLPTAALANSSTLQSGEAVLAIGNAG